MLTKNGAELPTSVVIETCFIRFCTLQVQFVNLRKMLSAVVHIAEIRYSTEHQSHLNHHLPNWI